MTDRELLELAAEAAGFSGEWGEFPGMEMRYGMNCGIFDSARGDYWNPLQDDGDAFRLMTKLGINVSSIGLFICATSLLSGGISVYENRDGVDAFSATRRAIVRAAAEIGRNAA